MSLQDMIILQNKCEELEEKLAEKHQELKDCEDCADSYLALAFRYDQRTTDLVNREAVIGELKEKLAAAEKAAMQNGCDRNKAEFKLAVADAKIDELKQQVVDYETDWRKMRKYYDGAMEKMAIAIEALEWLDEVIIGDPAEQVIREALEKIKRN